MGIALMKVNANSLMALINCAATTKAIIDIRQNNVLASSKTDGVSTAKDVTSYTLSNNIKVSPKSNGM